MTKLQCAMTMLKSSLFLDDIKLDSIIDIMNCTVSLQQSFDRIVSWAMQFLSAQSKTIAPI
jgi:hypothetical protein